MQVTLGFSCQRISIQVDFTTPLVHRTDSLNLTVQGYDLAGGNLRTDADARVRLKLGLDLTQPQQPRPYLDQDSQITVDLRIAGSNIDAETLGIHVIDGWAALDADHR